MEFMKFLSKASVLEIHSNSIAKYGGLGGVRDDGMLESALAMPSASFGDSYLHKDIFEMAAAYAYHIAMNHPFIDGNKRAGLASALAFLGLNEIALLDPEDVLESAMLKVAAGEMDKYEFADVLRGLPRDE